MDKQPCLLRRTLKGFEPADPATVELLRGRYGVGTVVEASLRKDRSLAHHRRYWALLTLVIQNIDQNISVLALHKLIKIRLGHVEWIKTASGVEAVEGSISFKAMDQGEFNEFYNKAVDFIIAEIMSSSRREIDAALSEMLGIAAYDSEVAA